LFILVAVLTVVVHLVHKINENLAMLRIFQMTFWCQQSCPFRFLRLH